MFTVIPPLTAPDGAAAGDEHKHLTIQTILQHYASSGANTTDGTSAPAAKTISYCHDHDVVCAPGFGGLGGISVLPGPSGFEQHTNYTSSEERDLGEWITNKLF